MRILITLLSLSLSFSAFSAPVFEKLAELNKCWLEQQDIDRSALAAEMSGSEQDWIRLHLTLVEHTLRARSTEGLTIDQKKNRFAALDHLHRYMLAGAFPQNEDYAYRTPIFIDKHDNFCAVGYLVKATGHEQVSRMIAANTNLAYVRDMKYPELTAWAKNFGFTIDELAWIQPAYGAPVTPVYVIDQGTDGPVREMYVGSGNKLYVGGNFAHVGNNISAGNIAYVTETNNIDTWHAMGTGVNGDVMAITEYNGNIYVGGSFTSAGGVAVNNIAYWDGQAWHHAGCLNGTVKDLVVFNSTLYASGNFSTCPSAGAGNFAYWTGSTWQTVAGLNGVVNTMEVKDTVLYLGGDFMLNNNQTNIVRWNSNIGFQALGNGLVNEVMDVLVFHDMVYASCKQTAAYPELFIAFQAGVWTPAIPTGFYASSGTKSFNTICNYNDSLIIGGDFFYYPMFGYDNLFNRNITSGNAKNDFAVDAPILKMVNFKGYLVSGGDFTGHIVRKFAAGFLCTPPPVTISSITDTSAHIVWMVYGGMYNYEYTVSSTAIPPSSGAITTNGFYDVTGLTPATKYYVHVRRSCTAQPYTTAWSLDSFTTLPPPPPPCSTTGTISITNITATTADIVWPAHPTFAMYQYLVNTDTAAPTGASVTFGNSFTAQSLTPDTKYYIHLRTICGVGDTSAWTKKDFITEKTSSVGRIPNDQFITVHPNPVTDKLQVNFAGPDATGTLVLTDITGKERTRVKVTAAKMVLEMAHLPRGLYILQYSNDAGSSIKKIVKE